jgi:sterol desaturase/sphingolipid hydroxylase (fatty acid hydroxylase superfamily)
MLDVLIELFARVQQGLYESAVQPVMFHVGLGAVLEAGFEATGWLLMGLLQVAVIVGVFVPLQRLWPVEPVTNKATIRTDMLYTLIHRLGLFRLALFFTVDPLFDWAFGALRQQGMSGFHLDAALGIAASPLLSFVAYLVVLDFVAYAIHRGQHQFNWWWHAPCPAPDDGMERQPQPPAG